MRRYIFATVALLVLIVPGLVSSAYAQALPSDSRLTFVDGTAGQSQVPIVQPYRRIETGNSPFLMSLYAMTAVTQALDIHSTIRALDRGGVETNPMLSGLTGNKAAFIAVKGAVAAASIFAARRLAKRNKVAAVASLIAINAAYGLVAHHNYKVAGRLQ